MCEFERDTGAREIYPSLDQTNKVNSKKKVFTEIQRDFSAEFRNSSGFSARKKVTSKKKRSSSQKFCKIRGKSTKITNMRVPNTNFGLDLHSSSPDPINFFGAQSSLGGAQFSFGGAETLIWGGTAPECPPMAPALPRNTLF